MYLIMQFLFDSQFATLFRSPPRPSPASITYSDDTPPPPITGAVGGAMKGPASEDTSSELSEKPSHLGDSSDDVRTLLQGLFVNDNVCLFVRIRTQLFSQGLSL